MMKFFILSFVVIGLATAQMRDGRCPVNEDRRNPTRLAHPWDCNKFLMCRDGSAIEVSCPIGQHWSVVRSSCDWPHAAGCQTFQPVPRPQPQPMPQPRPQPMPQPRPQPPQQQLPQRPQFPQQLPQFLPQRPIFPNNPRPDIEHPDFLNCPQQDIPGHIIYYPYHLNCSQFYQCVNGRAVLLSCPPDYSWDIRNNHCDEVRRVPCATPRRPI